MLHDHDGVGLVTQSLQRGDQALVVARMETDRRLVQHIHHARKPAPDLRGETDALHLASGERGARTVQREVIKPYVIQKLQTLDDLLVDVLHHRRQGKPPEMRQAVLHAHRHHFDDRLAGDGDGARLLLETRAVARRARALALVRLELLAPLVALGVLHHPLHGVQHARERLIDASPRQHEIVIETMHQLLAEGGRQLLVRRIELHLVLFRNACQDLVVVHDRHVSRTAPRVDAFAQRKRLVGDHKVLVKIVDGTESAAGRARPERRIERERTRLQLVKGDAAVLACVQLGIGDLFPAHDLDVDDAFPGLETQLHGIGEPRAVAGQHNAIYNHIDVMTLLLVEFGDLLDRVHRPVDAHAREPLTLDLGQGLLVPTLLPLHDRRVEDEF